MGIELGVSCAHVSMTLAGVGLTVLDFTADNHASNINARTLYTLSRQRQLTRIGRYSALTLVVPSRIWSCPRRSLHS